MFFLFTAMTTIICVPPETTLLIISWVPLLIFLFYALMEKRQFQPAKDATTHKEVAYTSLNQKAEREEEKSTWGEKRALIWRNLPLMLACFSGYFAEFLTLNGVVTSLAFPNSPFDPRTHFVYYACAFMIGEFIGRSYITLVLLLNSKCTPVVTKTWILSTMLLSLFIFLTFASWYRFLHSVWVVLLLIFFVGLLAGSLYLNTYLMAAGSEDVKGKAFSRAFLSVGPSIGVLVAGLVGLILEPTLREHCLHSAEFSEFCFTRAIGGWNRTTSCLR